MTFDARQAEVSARAVAALAEKLADDLRNNRLWPGQYDQARAEISRCLQSMPQSDGQR